MTTLADWKRALLALYPPGAFSRDPNSLHGVLAEADAKVLYQGAQSVEMLEGEPFPSTAVECLDEWETLYRAPHAPGATTAQRQAALVARWRGGAPFTLAGLRAIVADILNPEYVWRDVFDDAAVSWHYEQDLHNGTVNEAVPGQLDILINPAVDGRWTSAVKLGARLSLPLIVENGAVTTDDYWFCAKVTLNGIANNDVMAGIEIFGDDENAHWWGIHRAAGVTRVRQLWISDNVVHGPTTDTVVPAPPFWLVIGRVAGVTQVYLEADPLPSPIGPDVLSAPLGNNTAPLHPRSVGIFAWNDNISAPALRFGDFRMFYRLKHHNIRIDENHLAILSGASDPARWFAFIHRPPEDFGSGDLLRAALEVDKFKPGHVSITVGERDYFLCDDPHSLMDRDVFGS